ncbi:molybdenum ABC transporter, permease protein [Nautilia profundicola AmH]|uniref:Molybdenum ABC transporter, permease protein n=1 Tax=Nautilia profundicola (strain ATCC BAA-1463 / DSM 18972 / AmH) TaxID=598659 RepID=B9L7L4_NAUPA|nr:ABC transporter permease subunit [Nautilia profundicola]ACM93302.1 molybdenum ABC transporter, permease protein [Nautilia profundicola AmH]
MSKEAVFSLILTLKLLCADVILLIIFGTMLVYYLMEENSYIKKTVYMFIDLPLLFPPIATGFLLLWLFRDNGYIGNILSKINIHIIFGFWGLVLAGFVASVSLFIKPLIASIRQYPKNIIEASYMSGKSKFKTFVFIIMPSMKKVFIVSFILSVSRIFGEVGISLMLGGNIPFKTNTISIEIFSAVFNGDIDTAMYLSLIMFAVSFILFIFLKYIENNIKHDLF